MSISSIHPHHLTSPITQLKLQPYQRQGSTTWYPLKIELYHSARQCFEIKYTYAEFSQFSKFLHQHYRISKRALPLLKKEHQFLQLFQKRGGRENLQKYIDRQIELEEFCEKLLKLSTIITCSSLFLDFFSVERKQQLTTIESTSSSSSLPINLTLKRVFSCKSPVLANKQQKQQEKEDCFSRYSTVTVANLSASSPFYFNYKKGSMISTTTIDTFSNGTSKRSSTSDSSLLFPSSSFLSSEEEASTIKLKIVYDWCNIVIIRVPRSISLDQLRSRVIQKFALLNIQLPDQLTLLALTTKRCSSSSSSSIICSDFLDPSLVSLITEEQHLKTAMQTTWSGLQKVTLRCML